jgi:plastocyanin
MAARTWMLVGVGLMLGPRVVLAQSSRPATREELAKVQQEVRELRQMLIQAMQIEQQHHDLLLKLLQSGGGSAPATAPAGSPASSLPTGNARAGVVSGTVAVKGVPAGQPIFVYVEDLRAPLARGRSIEILQKDKQFSPQVTAVLRGTAVYFPNEDRVAHNVFSLSRRSTFDLGMLKSGERGRPVMLAETGVIEIFCDIHEKMWAEVLVTPNPYFTRVSNGAFRLPNVPAGERVIAVWTAGAELVKRTVQVTGAGAQIAFSLVGAPRGAHSNKMGQPYTSYAE